jgi:type I restriction enzyme S subunit
MMSVEGWKTVTIESCCEILDNKRIPINAEEREKRFGNVPYYGANGIQGYIDDYIFDEDLILIAEDGGYFNEFAMRPIAYRVSGKSWVNNHAHVLKAKSGYSQDIIFYFLEHKDIQPFIVGGTRAKLNQNELRSVILYLPESELEQTKIAEILDTIDEAIARTDSLIQKLKLMKAGLLNDLLTCGLDENGELRDPIKHPEQFKDSVLGRIPREWEVDRFERLSDAIDPQPDHRAPPEVNDGEPYIGVGDFHPDGSIDFESCRKVSSIAVDKQQRRFCIELGDILFGKIGTIGLPKFLPQVGRRYALNANTVLIKPKSCPSFVLWLLQSHYVEKQIQFETHSTSQPAFGILRIRAMKIPIPPLGEQERIVAILNAHNDRVITEETYLNKLKRQKQGLMHDLLTGKVRVT